MRYSFIILSVIFCLTLQGCFPIVAAGVGAGALMVEDRRSSGTYVDDQEIELKAGNRLAERFGKQAHVSITSFNRLALLTGETPTEEMKAEAEKIVAGVPNVKRVQNELMITQPTTLSARANDSFVTSKVKARFVDANRFQANHVKVITEAGVVYLMGLVTRKEADDATEIARTTSGVQKVVRVFEFLD